MTVIPCEQDPRLRAEIERFADVLKTQAHKLGSHGLEESSFYSSPIFRGEHARSWGVSRRELRNMIVIAHPESWVAPLE
jgi:hypothetical protein